VRRPAAIAYREEMTDPGTDFEDLADQLDRDERDPEVPSADAVEQSIPANPTGRPSPPGRPGALDLGLEVDEGDAVEQAQAVDLDDDYR
jgi:hypothetical protein